MTPNKTKSGLFETPTKKNATPAAPRLAKSGGRASTRPEPNPPASQIQSARTSVDRSPPSSSSHRSLCRPGSPRSVNSKSTAEQRLSASPTATSARDLPRTAKGAAAALREELSVAQEDLNKAKEQLVVAEKEKAQAVEELKEAKKQAYDASERLTEALAAQRQAEERTEIETFRAVELEQTNIEAAQQKEDAWKKELEGVRSQHALDVSSLATTRQELETLKQELMMTVEAKNAATVHADEALGIAEVNAEKVSRLTEEINHLKLMLDSTLESKDCEMAERLRVLNSEIEHLQEEHERAVEAEKKLSRTEDLIEDLRREVADAKKARLDAVSVAEDWKKKTEILEDKFQEAVKSERSSSDSLVSAEQKLEECSASLHDAESEIGCLKGKIETMEVEVARQKEDLAESSRRTESAAEEVVEMEKMVELLKSELRCAEEEKIQVLDLERKIVTDTQKVSEERDKLANDLQMTKDELEHSKRAMDELASALHEVNSEARETQKRLVEKQDELSRARSRLKELEITLKSTEERYEDALGKARNEIVHLKACIERSETEGDNENERILREKELVNSLKSTEEELALAKGEMEKVAVKLEGAESETAAAKEEGVKLSYKLNQAQSEASSAHDAAEKARAENLRTKERLLDKEKELQCVVRENVDLRNREKDALGKIEELTSLLEEVADKKHEKVADKKHEKENGGGLSDIENVHGLVSGTAEFSDDAGPGESEERKQEDDDRCIPKSEQEPVNEEKTGGEKLGVPLDLAFISKSVDDELSPETDERGLDQEALDDEGSTKSESGSLDQKNGSYTEKLASVGSSPDKDHHPSHKKRSPLFRKFGKLLKKKNHQNLS